jgi:hypothetical protein
LAAKAVAVAMELQELDLEEAEEMEAQMEAIRQRYSIVRAQIRQRALAAGVISLTEALDDTHIPSITQEEQAGIDM